MRKNKRDTVQNAFSILELDDDPIITATIQSYFQRTGYNVDVETDPLLAIETLRNKHYDILILDYLMTPITGDQVVERVREFDSDIFIILLTGHKNLVPPVKTVRELDIQGYYEKSDRYDQLEMLVESSVKAIKMMRKIKSYQSGLSDMADQLPGIYSALSYSETVGRISEAIGHLWHSDNVMISIDKSEECPEGVFSVRGEKFAGFTQKPALQLKAEIEGDGELAGSLLSSVLYGQNGCILGYVAAVQSDDGDLYSRKLFDIFIRQCCSSIDNVRLNGMVKNSYYELVMGLRQTVDARDSDTGGHSDRVGIYAEKLAIALGYGADTCRKLRLAGQFHDIGKISVPDAILLSHNRLTDEERAVIQRHPVKSAEILSVIPSFTPIVPIVRAHHERYDGKGYPDALAGENIPFEARIIAICDCFDAMVSKRRYSDAKSVEDSVEQLRRGSGTQFDGKMVDAFIKLVEETDLVAQVSEEK